MVGVAHIYQGTSSSGETSDDTLLSLHRRQRK